MERKEAEDTISPVKYRIRYGEYKSIVKRKGQDIVAKKVKKNSNDLYLSKNSKLKNYQVGEAGSIIDDAYDKLIGTSIKRKPKIIILANNELEQGVLASHNGYKNVMYVREGLFNGADISEYTKNFVFPNDPRSTIIYELVHVQQCERISISKKPKTSREYQAIEKKLQKAAKEQIDEYEKQGYNINVSKYASDSAACNAYDEIEAELLTYISLGGKP